MCIRHFKVPLIPRQWPRQTGRAAAAVDAEFGTGEGAEIESGLAEAGVRVAILFDGEEAIISEGENVAGQGVALGGIDLDEFESTRFEEFDGFPGEPGEIDKGGVIVEQTDQRHEMQAGGWAGTVGQRG